MDYNINFYAVGQGLFSSGHIGNFNFVYDCGTVSSQKLIKTQIDIAFKRNMKGNRTIDLLVISHFDKDHISGLDHLLKTYKVKTILLPYVDLPHRLFLAFSHKIGVRSEIMGFFTNPEEYLSIKYENKIENIIFIPPSNTDEIVREEEFYLNKISFENITNNNRVYTLKPKSALIIKDMFQFIPYNDASINPKLTKRFIKMVNHEKYGIENSNNSTNYQLRITTIRDLFDEEFGNNAQSRNIISLFLYISPMHSSSYKIRGYQNCYTEQRYKDIHFKVFSHDRKKNAILYTGDGYLKELFQLNNLVNYIGKDNFEGISCLQVMHHGAFSCWHNGLAKKINPCISVFSADHTRKNGHPHSDVFRDFLAFYPMIIDKERGLTLNFH